MSRRAETPHPVCFPVSDVPPAIEGLPEIAVRSAVERIVRSKVVTCPRADENVVDGGDFHPLIASAAIAYKQHYPLVLSPDMIWLTVLQGVAQHIANYSETLRSRMVLHETKIELVVDSDLNRLPQTDAEMLVATGAFVEEMEKHLQPDKRFLLRTEFSTTTDVERIAGSVVLMDAFQPYFDYVFNVICGIPSVILEGTPGDWESVGAKIRLLHESDLDLSWWTRHLLPLCDQFVRASQGDVDRSHWNDLCKLVERYGVDDLNGWLLKFIPYVRQDRNGVPCHRNPVLELTEFPLDTERMGKITGCTSDMLPTGLSFVPVACMNRGTGTTTAYQFVAGFTGVSQSSDDLSLRPAIGWAIAEATRIDRLIARLRTEHQVNRPERGQTEAVLRVFEGNLPGDFWKFYTETGGATLSFKNASRDATFCIIKPVSQLKLAFEFERVERELKELSKQGLLSPNDYGERRQFARAYSHLLVFAEAYEGKNHFLYLFGKDPEQFDGFIIEESRDQIFRWNGELTRESFEPVAPAFTDWLETMLERAGADTLS